MARGPRGWPILGNAPDLLRSPLAYLSAVSEKYDGLARLRMGGPMWVVSHPKAVRHVLQDNNKNYPRGGTLELISPVFGKGLATSDGEHWLKQRRMMQPAFHKDRMQRIIGDMDAEISECMSALPAQLELRSTMVRITQRVIVRTMFGRSLEGDVDRWCDALLTVEQHIGRHGWDLVPRPIWLPTPDNLKYRRAIAVLDELVYRLIDRRQDDAARGDLLDLLLGATDPDNPGDRMPAKQLRDEVMTIFIAGHDTTANTLSFALYHLGRDPIARRRVEEETRAADVASSANLPYTRAVLDETLRLYPPTWVLVREAQEADRIMDEPIEKGARMLLCPYATHRRKDVFPDPESFRPERFLGEKERPPFSYVPFGGGPHLCIGNHFAMAEALLVLHKLFRTFDVTIDASQKFHAEPAMLLTPGDPVGVTLSRRMN